MVILQALVWLGQAKGNLKPEGLEHLACSPSLTQTEDKTFAPVPPLNSPLQILVVIRSSFSFLDFSSLLCFSGPVVHWAW